MFKTLIVIAATIAAGMNVSRAEAPKPLMKDFLGINGHTINFKPELYRPTCELVRDYHNLDWDIGSDPSTLTRFPKGTPDKDSWIDWRKIYQPWKHAGFRTNVCVQWSEKSNPAKNWTDPKTQAYAYGEAFAQYFGSRGQDLVESIEIGNEPGTHYDDATYHAIFEHMARGVRRADPKMKILTCTVNVQGDAYSKPLAPFIKHKALFDVISVHQYSMIEGWPTWQRVYPEHPKVRYLDVVQEVIDFRDKHLPGKEVWLTEFGYDASTKPPPASGTFAKWKDVDDDAQARYIVRSFLLLAGMDIDRAYLFFFNDKDEPSFHASSGITRDFKPKMSYWAMRHLYQTLGEYRFSRVVTQEEGRPYVYEFSHGENAKDRVYVAWSPTDNATPARDESVELPAKPTRAVRMPLDEGPAPVVDVSKYVHGKVTIRIDGSPVYFFLQTP